MRDAPRMREPAGARSRSRHAPAPETTWRYKDTFDKREQNKRELNSYFKSAVFYLSAVQCQCVYILDRASFDSARYVEIWKQ